MKRSKLILSLAMCAFCLSFLVVGVWAAASMATLNITGNINYYTEGLFVELTGEVYRGNSTVDSEMTKLPKYTYGPVANFDNTLDEPSGNFPLKAWEIGNVSFVPNANILKIKVHITNYSSFAITGTPVVKIDNQDISTTIAGLTITSNTDNIQNIATGITGIYELTIQATTSTTEFTNKNLSISFEFEEVKPYTIKTENIDGQDYTFVYFGHYPQTYVGDSMNSVLEAWYTNKTPTDTYTALDGSTTKPPYNAYTYTDGETYVRVLEASPFNGKFDGEIEIQENETYWFKVEPIKWRVLTQNYTDAENTEPTYYLLSEFCLTANIRYSSNNAYKDSTLESFLNSIFLGDTFTEEEKEYIKERTLTEDDLDPFDYVSTDMITTLNVWAPTYEDMNTTYFSTNSERIASATDFALANYAQAGAPYWTSSSGVADYGSYLIYSIVDGACGQFYTTYQTFVAVRPALLFRP